MGGIQAQRKETYVKTVNSLASTLGLHLRLLREVAGASPASHFEVQYSHCQHLAPKDNRALQASLQVSSYSTVESDFLISENWVHQGHDYQDSSLVQCRT
jgi:hypothetical protein